VSGASGRPLRLLVQLPYPGYLRIYGSTLRELSKRGHTVLLAYDSAEKRRDAGAAETEELPGIELIEPLGRSGGRAALAGRIRPALDYLRYLDPRFGGAPYLRRRMEKFAPRLVVRLARLPGATAVAPFAVRTLRWLERKLPADPATARALEGLAPDAVVVSPLIARGPSGARQEDTVKAARALGIPVAAAITSWDHLTTKGLLKTLPDTVFVWNDVQRREAVDFHGVPASRIVVTGAQLFDQWFERLPTEDRATFAVRIGLDPGRPYVLYVGSSPNITPPVDEERFVRAWVAALRAAGSPLDELGVVVRPHPGNSAEWSAVDLSDLGAVVVPRERPEIPMTAIEEELYFLTIGHAAAVVGINTSAIIESLIQRRPVLTIRADEFSETQEGTLHFHYLVAEGGGCVRAARSIPEHVEQLRSALADPERERAEIERFLLAFVRPHGLDRPATPILADAIERLAAMPA
jgi:hypothetical protein